MPTYITTGFPNGGVTSPAGIYKVSYDNALSAADGLNKATALMADLESDFNIMNGSGGPSLSLFSRRLRAGPGR